MRSMKYEMLFDESITIGDHILYRIRALKDFGSVKAGDLGGWISEEANLSQTGWCWVSDEAKVFNGAMVYDSATICDRASVSGCVKVHGNSKVSGLAGINCSFELSMKYEQEKNDRRAFGVDIYNGHISDHALVYGPSVRIFDSDVCDFARVYDYATVYNGRISGAARIYDQAKVEGCVRITDVYCGRKTYAVATVCDNAKVFGNAGVFGNAEIGGNAEVCDEASVHSKVYDAKIHGKAKIFADICEDIEIDNAIVYSFGRVAV